MTDIPETSGNAQFRSSISDPITELPIYEEIPYYENSMEDPIYQIYTDARSVLHLQSLDRNMMDLQRFFRKSPITLPNIDVIIDLIGDRRRAFLLEDILFSTRQRRDLDIIFLEHRIILTTFLHRVRLIVTTLRQFFSQDQNNPRVSIAIFHVREEFLAAYAQLCSCMPEYNAIFQEAMVHADQQGFLARPVRPYLDFSILPKQPHPEAIELMTQCKTQLRALLDAMIDPSYADPPNYFRDLTKFLEEFPVQHWTQEYIIFILKKIKTEIENYNLETFLRKIDPRLYTTIVEHRALLREICLCMQTIQSHHRYFLWEEFKNVHSATAQTYFVEAFNKFRNHEQNYEAAIL